MRARLRVGVSNCLLGERVRYDGLIRLDPWVRDVLGARFDLVPVCPETELGLPVPREPIGLFGDPARPRLVGLETDTELTQGMEAWCEARVAELAPLGLRGFVLKSRSPSCGIGDAPVDTGRGEVMGSGLFVLALARAFPGLPMVRDEDLQEVGSREAFIREVESGGRG